MTECHYTSICNYTPVVLIFTVTFWLFKPALAN